MLADLIGRAADALREMDRACPCRMTPLCKDDAIGIGCSRPCLCDKARYPGNISADCLWAGHAAAACLRETLGEIVEAWHHVGCWCHDGDGSDDCENAGGPDNVGWHHHPYTDVVCEQARAAARERLTASTSAPATDDK